MRRIQTLGGLAVFEGTRPLAGSSQQPKRLAVLAVLARGGVRGVSRDRLAALLWPDTDEEHTRRSLNQALYALRQQLGSEETILGTRELRLNPDLVGSDVAEFEAAAGSGALEEAARLYGGPFLGDFVLPGASEFGRWAEQERDVLGADYRRIVEAVARASAGRGDWGGAVLWWRRLAALDRTDAEIAQNLMCALAAAGDAPGAIRHAEIFTAVRRQEFELTADPDVAALAERIRRGELPPRARRSNPHLPRTDLSSSPGPGTTTAAQPLHESSPPAAPSVAVLPFVNMSPERDTEYFSDGLTEELTNALTQVAGLRVASRTSAFAFKGKETDAREIGRRLNVRHLVEGSVRRAGEQIRITAQLVDAADGYHLWSTAYDRTLTDVFAVQDELARAIAGALTRTVVGSTGQPLVTPPTTSVEAYGLYLKGMYCRHKRTAEGWAAAIDFFQRAIDLDPNYAAAHVGLSYCSATATFDEFAVLPPRVGMPRARAAALRAAELDPRSADVHACQAIIAMLFDWDWVAAEREFDEARARGSGISANWHSLFLSAMGRHEESLRVAEGALELDPLSTGLYAQIGRCYYHARQFDRSIAHFRSFLEVEPGYVPAWVMLARAHTAQGSPGAALEALSRAVDLVGRQPILLDYLGVVLALMGELDRAEAILTELRQIARQRYLPVTYEAGVLASLGRLEEALDAYEIACEARSGWLVFVEADEMWDSLRAHPRFQAIMRRVGLPAAPTPRRL